MECTIPYLYDSDTNIVIKIWFQDASDKVALIIIDVQNDFISGSLALKNCPAKQEGEEVVDVINKLKNDFQFDLVVYTNDWHPKDHCSFITNVSKYPIHSSSKVSAKEAKTYDVVVYDGVQPQNQVLWPVHCEQGSEGAKLHPRLQVCFSFSKLHFKKLSLKLVVLIR